MAIHGYVEFADPSSVRGWAYDSDEPSRYVDIVVCDENRVYATGRADVRRFDLAAAGIGDESHGHGFSIDLGPAAVSAQSALGLDVYVASAGGPIKLPRLYAESNRVEELRSDVTSPASDGGQFPVFVLGAARSGTSAIALGLIASRRYEGTGEGHLLPLADSLLATIDGHYQRCLNDARETMIYRVPGEALRRMVKRGFVNLSKQLYPTGYWLDKTPTVEMVRAAPLMRELWPNARFIFMKRRVIENLDSRRRKFPDGNTTMHVSDWAAVMAAWLSVRPALAGAALEVEYRTLHSDPSYTSASISDFLEMPESAAARFRQYIEATRPMALIQDDHRASSFAELGLSLEDGRATMDTCNAMMSAYGYSYDESYSAVGELAFATGPGVAADPVTAA